jgi:RNA polymerase sigma factor (sigma-70 family)
MRAASIPARAAPPRPFRSRRLLALAGDERLVEQIRRGNEAAFEVAFERHGPAILAFCRHMLGSPEEAEDAVQHSFAAAYRDLQRDGERDIALKPWLFAIARNRCLSLLRARREQPLGDQEAVSTAGLAEHVEERAELRLLLADLRELPDEQRAALLLAEMGDLSHADVANVLGCEVPRVKALVFRARSALIARREARETPCEEIREQLANLRGGSLRRTELRLHLRDCPGCRDYREEVKRQRRMLAALLPVSPSLGLKSSVLAAAGLGGGSAGGGAAAAGLTGVAGAFGAGTVAKVAVVGALAGGGVVAGTAVVDSDRRAGPGPGPVAVSTPSTPSNAAPAARDPGAGSRGRGPSDPAVVEQRAGPGPRPLAQRRTSDPPPGRSRGEARGGAPNSGKADPGPGVAVPPGHAERPKKDKGERGRGLARGPVEAPHGRPVRRGPPDKPAKPSPQAQGQKPKPDSKPKPGAKSKPGAKPNPGMKPMAGPKSAPGPKPKTNAKPEPKPTSKPKLKPKSKPKPKSVSKLPPRPNLEPKPKSAPNPSKAPAAAPGPASSLQAPPAPGTSGKGKSAG